MDRPADAGKRKNPVLHSMDRGGFDFENPQSSGRTYRTSGRLREKAGALAGGKGKKRRIVSIPPKGKEVI